MQSKILYKVMDEIKYIKNLQNVNLRKLLGRTRISLQHTSQPLKNSQSEWVFSGWQNPRKIPRSILASPGTILSILSLFPRMIYNLNLEILCNQRYFLVLMTTSQKILCNIQPSIYCVSIWVIVYRMVIIIRDREMGGGGRQPEIKKRLKKK